jgi:hypothetical protein
MVELVRVHCSDASLAKFSAAAMNSEWGVESPLQCDVVNDGLSLRVENPVSAGLISLGKAMVAAAGRLVVGGSEEDGFGAISPNR